jgi:beta-glucosidase
MATRFGPEFLWGASTSAHQTEGNNTNSTWWALEHSGSKMIEEPSGDACDSYRRWPEDMDLLAGAGFTDYRFSIEWARIEPAPGEFSRAALDHYRRMIDGARDRGLRPLVTLHHFTTPIWFELAGGWTGPNAIGWFLRYVEAAAEILVDRVGHVCTINEPNVVAMFAALRANNGAQHSDLQAATPDARVTGALIEAHRKASAALRAHTGIQVGWSIAWLNAYAQPGAEDVLDEFMGSRQRVFVEASDGDDWIGVQTYTRTRIGRHGGGPVPLEPPAGAERTLTGWEYYPPALGEAVRSMSRESREMPIIVTENGIATADDSRRIDFTTRALASLRAAMDDGVDVRGYFHWSLLDNYEWGSYKPTFGLVAVDRETFIRTPKPSLFWLGSQNPARRS